MLAVGDVGCPLRRLFRSEGRATGGSCDRWQAGMMIGLLECRLAGEGVFDRLSRTCRGGWPGYKTQAFRSGVRQSGLVIKSRPSSGRSACAFRARDGVSGTRFRKGPPERPTPDLSPIIPYAEKNISAWSSASKQDAIPAWSPAASASAHHPPAAVIPYAASAHGPSAASPSVKLRRPRSSSSCALPSRPRLRCLPAGSSE